MDFCRSSFLTSIYKEKAAELTTEMRTAATSI